MGEITVSAQDMDHLLRDPASAYGAPYQRTYAEVAETHRGRAPRLHEVPVGTVSSAANGGVFEG
ncbi:hypothetical protein ACFCXK_31705 [Streptomyces sp. NPDC056269]|uniref:hypothetical protein n=1 Tax=Streptomyces sp. NPDC056269 TaxID=3345768 RepID=UPI0035D8C4FD